MSSKAKTLTVWCALILTKFSVHCYLNTFATRQQLKLSCRNKSLDSQAASASFDCKSLFEGDVVFYETNSQRSKSQLNDGVQSIASVTSCRKLQPLYRRGDREFDESELILYEDTDEEPIPLSDPSIVICEIVDGFLYTQRIVEDRVSNPHGEHAEDVWILNDAAAILSILNKSDLSLRIGPFQH
jgi:hypothetical protein